MEIKIIDTKDQPKRNKYQHIYSMFDELELGKTIEICEPDNEKMFWLQKALYQRRKTHNNISNMNISKKGDTLFITKKLEIKKGEINV